MAVGPFSRSLLQDFYFVLFWERLSSLEDLALCFLKSMCYTRDFSVPWSAFTLLSSTVMQSAEEFPRRAAFLGSLFQSKLFNKCVLGNMELIMEIFTLKVCTSSSSSSVNLECGEDLCLGSPCHRRAKYLKKNLSLEKP